MITTMDKPDEEFRRLRREAHERKQTDEEAFCLALSAMEIVEWRGKRRFGDLSTCPWCRNTMRVEGHAPDCQLAEAIKDIKRILGRYDGMV